MSQHAGNTRLQEILAKEVKRWGTKEALARHLGVSGVFIGEIINGKKQGFRKIPEFAEKLGRPVSDFYDEKPMLTVAKSEAELTIDKRTIEEYPGVEMVVMALNRGDLQLAKKILDHLIEQIKEGC
jgi:hypothetical protein